MQRIPRYDFKSLSGQDFEELIRDLLQAEWKITLESFRSGRDGGIDLRYAPANDGATIIQCKHYATSGFAKLLANLRDSELPKIRRLRLAGRSDQLLAWCLAKLPRSVSWRVEPPESALAIP